MLIDEEIVRYQAISAGSVRTVGVRPWGLRHAGSPARRRSPGRHLTERHGWYVASAELAEDIGRSLARLDR